MKKILRYVLIIALVAGVVFTFVYLWKKSRPKKEVYELVVPEKGNIEQKNRGNGKSGTQGRGGHCAANIRNCV